MASAIARSISPLKALPLVGRYGMAEVSDAGSSARICYRGSPDALVTAIGLDGSTPVCRASTQDGVSALRLGPDEWLVVAAHEQRRQLLEALRSALIQSRGCAVDISDRHCGLRLTGPRGADVLSSACPLDLDLQAFPVGMCTRSLFGKAEVILWRIDRDAFLLETGRSFAPYVTGLLSVCVKGLPKP